MGKELRIRHQSFLPKALRGRLGSLARVRRAAGSRRVAAAIAASLDRRGKDEFEQRIAQQLARLSGQLARIGCCGHATIGNLRLFIRSVVTSKAPRIGEHNLPRAIGRERFAAFITRVGQQLASGRRSISAEDGR